MAVTCDYCNEPIDDVRVDMPPPVLPPNPNPLEPPNRLPPPLNLHPECAQPFWKGMKKLRGNRPAPPPPSPPSA